MSVNRPKSYLGIDIKIYYINLNTSSDRNTKIIDSFKSFNITDYTRIPAIDGKSIDHQLDIKISPNELGCVLSHITAIKQAYSNLTNNPNYKYPYVIIMEDDCKFDYLTNHDYSIHEIVSLHPDYDIYQLGYSALPKTIIQNISSPDLISDKYHYGTFSYLITLNGMKKIINTFDQYYSFNNNSLKLINPIPKPNHNISVADSYLYANCKTCCINRPYFTYDYTNTTQSIIRKSDHHNKFADTSKSVFDNYYKSISIWDRIYCVNLGIDIVKYYQMMKYCRFFNKKPSNFFYSGILGRNIPHDNDHESIIKTKLIHPTIQYQSEIIDQKYGTLGLNITHYEIFNHASINNYKKILLLEDDIYFDIQDFITYISDDSIYDNIKHSDIFYLGSSSYLSNDQINEISVITKVKNRSLLNIKSNLSINKKYYIAGGFGLSFSNKSVQIFKDLLKTPETVSDRLFSAVMLNQKSNFQNNIDNTIPLSINDRHDLQSFILTPNLINVHTQKTSLTNTKIIPKYFHPHTEQIINLFTKINNIHFKLSNNLKLKIVISDETNYKYITDTLDDMKINYSDQKTNYHYDIIFKKYSPNIIVSDINDKDRYSLIIGLDNSDNSNNSDNKTRYDSCYDMIFNINSFKNDIQKYLIYRQRKILCLYTEIDDSDYKINNDYDYTLIFTKNDFSNSFLYGIFDTKLFEQIPNNKYELRLLYRKISDYISINDTITLSNPSNKSIIIDPVIDNTESKNEIYDYFTSRHIIYNRLYELDPIIVPDHNIQTRDNLINLDVTQKAKIGVFGNRHKHIDKLRKVIRIIMFFVFIFVVIFKLSF